MRDGRNISEERVSDLQLIQNLADVLNLEASLTNQFRRATRGKKPYIVLDQAFRKIK